MSPLTYILALPIGMIAALITPLPPMQLFIAASIVTIVIMLFNADPDRDDSFLMNIGEQAGIYAVAVGATPVVFAMVVQTLPLGGLFLDLVGLPFLGLLYQGIAAPLTLMIFISVSVTATLIFSVVEESIIGT